MPNWTPDQQKYYYLQEAAYLKDLESDFTTLPQPNLGYLERSLLASWHAALVYPINGMPYSKRCRRWRFLDALCHVDARSYQAVATLKYLEIIK